MKPFIKYILLGALLLFGLSLPQESKAAEEINATQLVMEHTADAHDWHITTINGHAISIPLPVIIKTSQGWQCFMSSQMGPKLQSLGLTLKDGKIYEGSKRVLDISITKDVVQLWIVVILLIIIFVSCSRWYKGKKPSDGAPKGFVGLIEMLTMFIYDDIIKETIPEKHIHKYAPFLLTAFFFIFLSNIMGLIPIFPGGANLTGNIAITFFLALCTMLLVNLFGNKHYWKDIFWPDVPWWLKVPIPIIPVIELFGVFTKPFALMIRLFANIFGGHAVAISLTCVIFITFQKSIVTGASVGSISFLLMIFMDFLELLVAFIQAFVFTMLSSVFIGLAHQGEEEPQKKLA
ncbi:MAG: F0F1 ATP synthase subunit A [Prevotellaceae bacterium]|jgi:F-type H+-transporting ATPase subunit a|nr:F0F1 ATP synthase subunit A [Prevotellaceae bacterium]MDY3855546.1 F0F1 ATP synthase subunit A [Bacteroidaceae bacterium]